MKLADGLDAMKRSGLSRRAIVVILHDLTRVAKRDIEAILDAPIRTFMLVK